MSSIVSIATSGMSAASLRLEAVASNVANVSTTGALPAAGGTVAAGAPRAYTPLVVDQVDVAGGGTAATVKAVSPATVAVSDPTAPYADQSGLVAAPNVDLTHEMIQLMVARYTFAANAAVARTGSQLTKTLVDTMV
jgi:flagellar basal-body rod protein FlgC